MRTLWTAFALALAIGTAAAQDLPGEVVYCGKDSASRRRFRIFGPFRGVVFIRRLDRSRRAE